MYYEKIKLLTLQKYIHKYFKLFNFKTKIFLMNYLLYLIKDYSSISYC